MKKFEIARTYTTCDQDVVFSFTVTRRTEKSVWIKGESIKEETRRAIKIHDGEECIMPLGSYAMAPSLRASRVKPLETLSENVARLEYVYKSKGFRAGFQYAAEESCQLRENIKAIMDAYALPTMEEKDAEIPTRTWDAIRGKLAAGHGFVTVPGDVYTIEHTPGVICSTITVGLFNERRGEDITMSIDNKLASWEFLKGLDGVGGREVRYHIHGSNRSIPFKESRPYIHRFGTQAHKWSDPVDPLGDVKKFVKKGMDQ